MPSPVRKVVRFILKIFLKFCTCQPPYSYEICSFRKSGLPKLVPNSSLPKPAMPERHKLSWKRLMGFVCFSLFMAVLTYPLETRFFMFLQLPPKLDPSLNFFSNGQETKIKIMAQFGISHMYYNLFSIRKYFITIPKLEFEN